MANDGSIGVPGTAGVSTHVRRAGGPRGLLALALLAIATCLYLAPIQSEWDSHYLYEGLFDTIAWARRGFDGTVRPGPFPIFQYLTGLPAVLAGMWGLPISVFAYWAFTSLLSLGGVAWVLWRVGRRYASTTAGWMLVVVLLSGPLIAYASSTFNELPAALVTTCFAAAAVSRGGPVLTATLFVAAGLTKEIAAPLLVPIWLAGLWLRRDELARRAVIHHVIALGLAFAAAVAMHMGFNLLRYGTVVNLHYLSEEQLVRPWGRRAQNAIAVWLAPNGGLIPFWPTLAVVVAAVGIAERKLSHRGGMLKREGLIPLAAIAATLGALTLGLAGFHQPFGWWSWGPRLLLPWLPAVLVVAVRAYPIALDRTAKALLARRGPFIATATGVCILSLPHLLTLASPESMKQFFMPDPQFPHGASPQQPDLHYARQVFLAWRKWPPALARPFAYAPPPPQAAATVAYLGAIVVLLWRARLGIASVETANVTRSPDLEGADDDPSRSTR